MIIWYLFLSQDTQRRALRLRRLALEFIPNGQFIPTSKLMGTGLGYQVK
jgi:hypothetical protein